MEKGGEIKEGFDQSSAATDEGNRFYRISLENWPGRQTNVGRNALLSYGILSLDLGETVMGTVKNVFRLLCIVA